MELNDNVPGLGEQISRLLVANRGEIAVRVFETAREMGITCVAVFSDPDRDSRHVRAADYAVHLPGSTSAETYLNIEAVLAAARRTDVDAIHPGYGFLAENPEFAAAVIAAGFTWIGPPPEVIAAMALKVQAKNAAAAAGVPLVPGAELPARATDVELLERASQVGYPVMIKASAGGGGKGMRVVESPDTLVAGVRAAERESQAAFGDATVFLERYLPRSRHVEVQVFGDGHGNFLHLFDRECSIQRRHQKIIEEAPSPGTTDSTRQRMYAAALSLCERIGYIGAGTVEFLVSGDGDAQEFFFLEMNTRLQVEHRVTEEITGTDLVQWQILVAQGKEFNVDQDDLEVSGHAIEVRLYAEDPANGFLPSVGTIKVFEPPADFGPVVDAGYSSGDTVSQYYDPLLAKITVQASDRETATRELIEALTDTTVVGVTTNRDMLLAILSSFPFFAADTTTAFLDEHPALLTPHARGGAIPPPEVLVAAAFRYLDGLEFVGDWSRDPFQGNLATDPVPPRWRNVAGTPGFLGLTWGPTEDPQHVWVRFDSRRGSLWSVSLGSGPGPFDGDAREVGPVRVTSPVSDDGGAMGMPASHLLIEIEGVATRLDATIDAARDIHVRGPDHRYVFRVARSDGAADQESGDLGPVSPVPGTVAAVEVSPGEIVSEGQTLVILEAMKMEHRITAESAGTVDQVLVAPGQSVDAHQVLVTFAVGAGEGGIRDD
jgi:acetyl/propionyl-CoA carboxylase alpha subunit